MNSRVDAKNADDSMVEKIEDTASSESSASNNPKLWPRPLKLMVLFNVCLMTFNGQFYAAGLSTSFAYLVQEFQVSYSDVAPTIYYVVIMVGVSSLIWIPMTNAFGKRLVLIASSLIFLAGCIWGIYATSLNSLIGSRVLGGFGVSAVQAIGPAVLGDVFFERDYSKVIAMYSMCLCIGAQLGPLFAGHISLNLGWRWLFKIVGIILGFNLLTTITLLPETTFTQQGSADATAASLDEQLNEAVSGRNLRKGFVPALRKGIFYRKHPHVRGGGVMVWIETLARHLPFLVDPIVICSAGLWGIVQSWVIVISVCSSQLFAPPPFLFTPAQLGNWTGTSMVGIILAFPIAGPLVDIMSRKLSERNGGHKPEYRLYSMIIPFIICSPGLLLFVYTFIKGSYVGPAIGFAMQAAGLTLVPSATISYVIDSHPFHAPEAVASINLLTHLISFALSKTANDWLLRVGVKKLFIDMAVIEWALFIGLTLPLLFFGPWLRKTFAKYHEKIDGKKLRHRALVL